MIDTIPLEISEKILREYADHGIWWSLKLHKCKILYQYSQLPGIISKLGFLISDA